jgi:hypothetical protein
MSLMLLVNGDLHLYNCSFVSIDNTHPGEFIFDELSIYVKTTFC